MKTTKEDQEILFKARSEWQQAVRTLMENVRGWAEAQEWTAAPTEHELREQDLGTYAVPGLQITTPRGQVILEPVGRVVIGAQGRVDFYAWPSLYRVMLLRKTDGSGDWVVRTDFGPRWPHPWGETTFVQLAEALLDEQ